MTPNAADVERAIRQVVRGERPWMDLCAMGMQVQLDQGVCRFDDSGPVEARVDIHDLARGFLTHMHDSRRLREWAFVMEGLPVDLDVEGHPAGEKVLDALWSASFGEPLTDDQIRVLEDLGGEVPNQS